MGKLLKYCIGSLGITAQPTSLRLHNSHHNNNPHHTPQYNPKGAPNAPSKKLTNTALIPSALNSASNSAGLLGLILKPPSPIRLCINSFRCVVQHSIHRNHLTTNRRVNIRCGFYRFHYTGFFTGHHLRAEGGDSAKTTSPRASWAWSVMPTVTVPVGF